MSSAAVRAGGLIKRQFCTSSPRLFVGSTISNSFNKGPPPKPIKVLVTGAAGQIGYSLLPRIARSEPFRDFTPVMLKMLDLPSTERIMHGIKMELEDCAFSALRSIEVYTDPEKAYSDVDLIVMLANGLDLKAGMPRSDLLRENLRIYKETAEVLKRNRNESCKILMIANPANTNSLLLIESLKGVIPSENITCLTRLDHNRTKAMLARKLEVPPSSVRKVMVWGNHSSSMCPDIRFAEVYKPQLGWVNVSDYLHDNNWFYDELVPTVRERAYAVIQARNKSSALSAANAGIDHLRSWFSDTKKGDWVSMGVYSDSSYSGIIPDGVVFGQPCTCENGKYSVVKDFKFNDRMLEMLANTSKELLEERASVLS